MYKSITIRFCLIFIFLSGIFLTDSKGQSSRLSIADSLFAAKEYFKASIEYERYIFYGEDMSNKLEAKYKKSLCYRFMGQNEQALKELGNINVISLDIPTRRKIIYEKVYNLYCLGRYNESLINIERLKFYEKDSSDYFALIPYKVLCYNSLRKWKDAEQTISKYIEGCLLSEERKGAIFKETEKLYSEKMLPKYYNPKTAENLSRFVPGSGQFYSGHIKEGLFAFGMNAGLLTLGLYNLYYKYYFTAYVVGFGLFYESYTGGMRRVSQLAERKNKNTMIDFNRKCIALLLEINEGYREQQRLYEKGN